MPSFKSNYGVSPDDVCCDVAFRLLHAMNFRAWPLQQAARIMRAGGVIAYPTEAVWGLGCDPYNPQAVSRLLALKHRPMHKGLIMVTGDLCHVRPWLAALSSAQQEKLQQYWPGFSTWVVPDAGLAPEWIKGEHPGVALRVSAHPLIRALCQAFGGPIVSTSANIAGQPAARQRWQVERYFHGQLDYLLFGPLGGARRVSAIRDLVTGKPLRGA